MGTGPETIRDFSEEKPWQDAMARIEGRVAEQVAMVLVERWWNLGDGGGLTSWLTNKCVFDGCGYGRYGYG